MIRKAFIQEDGNGRSEPEMRDVLEELRDRGVPVEVFTRKRILRKQLSLSRETLVVGYVPIVPAALNQLEIEAPRTNDYPTSVQRFLRRRMWTSTVGELTRQIYEGSVPTFAKPHGRKKRFTGRVFESQSDIMYLEGASRALPIICSEVVEWTTEYRVFVIQGELVGVRHYAGDVSIDIDHEVAAEIVNVLEEAGEGTAAYGIDLGVLRDGRTALVEFNDGFSLGSYGLDKALYTDVLIARWCQLME